RFIRSHMKQTVWKDCSLCYSNFSMAVLEQVQITDSVMKMSAMPECRLKQLQLDRVNLEEVDFFKTSLKNLDLSKCEIRGISVSDSFRELAGVKIDAMQAAELALLLGVKIV
ncbi:MAG: pentapeptide repeat-containing protein, partial [Lachnospiraceae bacterium]|nr:pentapeptide repeat-containing protein [Lachnospiraceae bacterium]